jgi:fumarate hydratase, class II
VITHERHIVPTVAALRDAISTKSKVWDNMVKIGRTHKQDATPLTLGQEWSAYAGMLTDDLERIVAALDGVYRLALGGTAVGAGINSAPGFAEALELAPQQRRQKTVTAPLQACPACGASTITPNP